MRLNLRLKFGNLTYFSMLSKTQTLLGIGSKVQNSEPEKHLHYIFWDLEKCNLNQVVETLFKVQKEFNLGDIYVTSDKEEYYRAYCFSQRQWLDYLHILLHTKHVDYGFWIWTVRRGEATLRLSEKEKRKPQEVVHVLKGYEKTELPQKIKLIKYDTGIEKKGLLITNYR